MGHTILEASAGTGKTYRITKIVTDKIKAGSRITEMLIMTYTEAAAGELRDRIRTNLMELDAGNISDIEKENIKTALTDFDMASICTIHSFCKEVMSNYAFQCQLSFHANVNNDPMVYKKAYQTVIYRLGSYINTLPEETKQKLYSQKYYQDNAIKLAIELYSDDKIEPEVNLEYIPQKIGEYAQLILDISPQEKHSIIEQLTNKRKKARADYAKKAVDFLLDIIISNDIEYIINQAICESDKLPEDQKEYIRKIPEDIFPTELKEAITIISNPAALYSSILFGIIARETAKEAKCINHDKLQYTYNDLIETVADEVKRDNSPLLAELQKRYNIGIIDEFQDTNPLQWTIINKMFVEGNPKAKELITAGDPKQSIYSFQGANVYTYEKAVHAIAENGKTEGLEINYRTNKHLLDIFNTLFIHSDDIDNIKSEDSEEDSKRNWFSRGVYKTVGASEKNNITLNPDYKYFNIVNLTKDKEEPKSEIQKRYAGFIAREIIHFIQKHPYEDFKLSDIYILIRNKKESICIEDALKEAEIPYTFYKKTGVYSTRESKSLFFLLRAIAYEHREKYLKEALIGDFFKEISIENIDSSASDNQSNIFEYFNNWRDEKYFNDFSALIRDIYSETKILEISLKESGERSISIYLQIARTLENYAISEKKNLYEVIDYFQTLIDTNTESTLDEDTEEINTEKEKVKIMTMHASKGLENKIIFIAGGFNKNGINNNNLYYKYTDENGKIIDTSKSQKDICEKQEAQESRRLFYVALTRAKYMLYLPEITNHSKKTILKEILNSIINVKNNPEEINKYKTTDKEAVILSDYNITYSDNMKFHKQKYTKEEKSDNILNKPQTIENHYDRAQTIESFSSISKKKSNIPEEDLIITQAYEPEEEPQDEYDIPEDILMLPKGTNTGLLLHEILEKADFTQIMSYKSFDEWKSFTDNPGSNINIIMDNYYTKNQQEILKENVYKIIWNTLHTQLPGTNARIGDIKNKLCELDFFMPYNFSEKNYLKGIVDMIFSIDKNYYILDWKSNITQNNIYKETTCREIMDKHDYNLQAEIYGNSLIAWLKSLSIDPNLYRGAFYVFLRNAEISDSAAIIFNEHKI